MLLLLLLFQLLLFPFPLGLLVLPLLFGVRSLFSEKLLELLFRLLTQNLGQFCSILIRGPAYGLEFVHVSLVDSEPCIPLSLLGSRVIEPSL